MPMESSDQRRLSAMPAATLKNEPFSDEMPSYDQKEVGFQRPEEPVPDSQGVRQMIVSRSKPVTEIQSIASPQEILESHRSHVLKKQNGVISLQHIMGSDKKSGSSASLWRSTGYDFGFLADLCKLSTSPKSNGNTDNLGVLSENSLFSNSLPETFSQKVTFPSRGVLFSSQSHEVHSSCNDGEPLESLKEIEARTIGNLLPDDDELFSGMNEIVHDHQSNSLDDVEEDIFRMDLELDDGFSSCTRPNFTSTFSGRPPIVPNGAYSGEHSHVEFPSRTLHVRNINSSFQDDELRSLFEKYGDIRMLYTACKHRGFVMISYYDIRSAINAMKLLQNNPLQSRRLDIQYFVPKENSSKKDINHGILEISNLDLNVSNDDIHQIFSAYGEIKEINQASQKTHKKTVEFYDSRAAEAALHALDGSHIAGKQIKLEPGCTQFAASALMPRFPSVREQEEDDNWQQGTPPECLPVCCEKIPVHTISVKGEDNRHTVSPVIDGPDSRFSYNIPHFVSPQTPSSRYHCIDGSIGRLTSGFQTMPNITSHSLPEYKNDLSLGMFKNSPGIFPAKDVNTQNYITDRTGSRCVRNDLLYDRGDGASGNASCPLHGYQYPRNRLHSGQFPHAGNMMWQNSPPFVNNLIAHSPTQLHGFPRTPPHMLNNMVPFHHVGSAPATNVHRWDGNHGYTGDLVEAPSVLPASLGSMGFSASPILHPMDIASCRFFPIAEGNYMEAPVAAPHIRIPSSQQSHQMFSGQNPMIHFNSRYVVPNERIWKKKNDAMESQGDIKKQYELDIERIVQGEDSRTTLMIKNIPNKYTSKMLLATIDEHHRGTYDFIYLPIDFKNKCNVGYAFINLTDPKHVIPFYESFNGKKWEKFNSEKVASLAYARIQGKVALVAHFQNSSLMNEDKRCRPLLFHSDGPNAGDQEPFPTGSSIRPRPGRPRNHSSDDEQGSPSNSSGGEIPNGLNSNLGLKKSIES